MYDYQTVELGRALLPSWGLQWLLQTDGYGVYDGLHLVTNVGCLAHARRKFMEAKKLQGKGSQAKRIVHWLKSRNSME
ncbi:IS66 family transposase [Vibrio anguillarum]|uniref:IS66 family transposase n=1 Tax=Vibrio anguillarum TaxID=55601 RepID=UPI0039C16289